MNKSREKNFLSSSMPHQQMMIKMREKVVNNPQVNFENENNSFYFTKAHII